VLNFFGTPLAGRVWTPMSRLEPAAKDPFAALHVAKSHILSEA
jgi:hypothetical protein